MKRFNYGNEKGILVIKDSHEETEYRMTMPDDVAYVVALLNVSDKALADRDSAIAEMREALEAHMKTHVDNINVYVTIPANQCNCEVCASSRAILAKYPQKGK